MSSISKIIILLVLAVFSIQKRCERVSCYDTDPSVCDNYFACERQIYHKNYKCFPHRGGDGECCKDEDGNYCARINKQLKPKCYDAELDNLCRRPDDEDFMFLI
jgi:hypothetical protein